MLRRRDLLPFLALTGTFPGLCHARAARAAEPVPRLDLITYSDYQWTGVAVSREGRVFVTFPTLSEFPSFHVGELKGGVPVPLLDRETNKSFTSLTGIYLDEHDRLWVLDSGKLEGLPAKAKKAKLVQIDLRRNMVHRTFPIQSNLITPISDLQDLRIDVEHNCAYISDGGAGGILAIDLRSGSQWLALDRTVEQTRANASFIAYPHGNYMPHAPHVNGMTLSEDGKALYFTPLIETRIFTIPTEVLANRGLTSDQRRKHIRILAEGIHPSAGMVVRKGVIYMGDLQNARLMTYSMTTRRASDLPYAVRFHWADDFAKDANGNIWFTESENDIQVEKRYRYRLYRLTFHD